jgi:beta-fructofuranosidase
MSAALDGTPQLAIRGGGRVDDGRSLYAPQVALDADGLWFLGWVMQVGSPGESPEHAVAGCLTLPRRLRVDGDRVLSVVDRRLTALLGPDVTPGPDGELPPHVHVRAAGDAVTLRGRELSVTLPLGAEAWVDGEVLEVYPVNEPPRTYRDPDTARWHLVGDPAAAAVRAVRTSAQDGHPVGGPSHRDVEDPGAAR